MKNPASFQIVTYVLNNGAWTTGETMFERLPVKLLVTALKEDGTPDASYAPAGDLSLSIDPVPGPVLGMLFLFVALVLRGGPGHELQTTSGNLLQHLSLLFVPAGTGIMIHLHRVADEWLPLLLSLLVSTVATMVVTALVMKLCMRGEATAGNASGDAP